MTPTNSFSSIPYTSEATYEENEGVKGTRGYIRSREIEGLAVRKYRESGKGIQYSDVIKEFRCSKAKAQRIIKYSCNKTISVLRGEHNSRHHPILFRSPEPTNPQTYFPRCLKADIIENLKEKSKRTISRDRIDDAKATSKNCLRSFFDNEDPLELLYIHKIHLMTSINREYYNDLDI